ncbi:MAG: GAF domain-containing protein [Pseudomonadota bacterium]
MSDGGLATDLLSKREREVATAYASGASNKEIARDLGLSPTTVRSHLRTVYSKLGVTSKIELAQTLNDQTGPREDRDRSEMAADLALELDDAIRRECSLASVLRIISNHDGSLETTIDDVLKHALEICEAEFGILFEYHGDFRVSELRSRGISPVFRNWLSEVGTFKIEPTTGVGRAASELKPVSIDDVRAGGVYESGSALRIATIDHGIARSLAAIPMTSGNRLIGVFSIYRTRVHPFNERTLDLIQLFADQAVIAIENVRQFRAIQNANAELESRLEREEASAEILEVISQSRDDDRPVFDVILERAQRLCDVTTAALVMVRDDGMQEIVAHHGVIADTIEIYQSGAFPMDPKVSFGARAMLEAKVVHLHDMKDTDEYRAGYRGITSLVNNQGIRTNLLVPLIADGRGIGYLVLFRNEVRPFTPDQIALVETFAAQAVIAIENVRQFKALESLNAELGERVEEQVSEIERMGKLKRFLLPPLRTPLSRPGRRSC